MSTATGTPMLSGSAEAFAAIALAAVACDGELAGSEALRLRQQLEFRHPFCTYSDGQMAALLDRLLLILRREGCEALMAQAATQLEPTQRDMALAVAADLTAADHVETGDEQRFLRNLAVQLQIPAERSAQILEVIGLLNSDSLAG